jgi:hypothetical protein
MGKLTVKYEVEAEKMPDNCAECAVVEKFLERCPLDIWYWKAGDMPMLYAKFTKKRHKDCPIISFDEED